MTGGGKTSFALMCLEEYFSRNKDGSVLILVPSVALLDQWYVDIITDTSLKAGEISVFGGGNKNSGKRKVNISTLNTARKISREILSENDLLIVDECHKAASKENSKAILSSKSYHSLGLSATPERQYDEGFEQILIPRLGPIIIDYSYSKAKKDGVICDFELHNVRVRLTDEEQEKYEILTKKIAAVLQNLGTESPEYLSLCVKRREISNYSHLRLPIVCDMISKTAAKKSIIFHESIDSAEKIAQLLNNQKYRLF